MSNTIQIIRSLLSLRSYDRINRLMYCTHHKDGTHSDEKERASSNPSRNSTLQRNQASGGNTDVKNLQHEEENKEDLLQVSSSSSIQQDENQKTPTDNSKLTNEKVDDIKKKMEPEPKSSVRDSKYELLGVTSDGAVESGPPSDEPNFVQDDSNFKTLKKNIRSTVSTPEASVQNQTFASLLRNSAFVELGDPVGKLVIGEIFHVVDNDLYIDFGWKFHTVCRRPAKSQGNYSIGTKVLLRIKDLELTAKFLGDNEYTSLLEADCDLISQIRKKGDKVVQN